MDKNYIVPPSEIKLINKLIQEDRHFPNNPLLPLLVYQNALILPKENAATVIEEIFKENKWTSSWRNGIYDYHHYHSTSHEVLGIYRGQATVQLGGPHGMEIEIQKGDVIILPAGTAHKKIHASTDFACVGAYPTGQDYDMQYGKPGERPNADHRIQQVPYPKHDPVYGYSGPLLNLWRS